MSKFEKIVLQALKEAEETRIENMLNEDLASWARAAMFGGALALSSMNPADAKTNIDALHNNHEITAKREHGGKGHQAIAKDSYGGYSYGKWQLSTERRDNKPSTFDFFLKYARENDTQIYEELEKAGGQPAAFRGDKKFIETWKRLADLDNFQILYDDFLLQTQIIPVYNRMDNSGSDRLDRVTTWGSEDNAIQAAIKSMIVQHGSTGAYNMIKRVMEAYNPDTKEAFLQKIYTYRISKFPAYKRRYNAEYADLKRYLGSGTSKIVLAKNKNGNNLNQLIDLIQNQV